MVRSDWLVPFACSRESPSSCLFFYEQRKKRRNSKLNAPKLLLATPSAHLGMAVAGEEDGVVAAEDEAAVVVEAGTGGEIMTVMPRLREKENSREGRKVPPPRMRMWV